MTDNIDDLLAELDIDGLDDIDDISDEGARRLVDNIDIEIQMEQEEEEIDEADKIPEEMKGKDLSAFFSTNKDDIDDADVDDVDLDDVDEMLKKAFLDDEVIDEEAVDGVMEAALETEKNNSSNSSSVSDMSESNDIENETNDDEKVEKEIIDEDIAVIEESKDNEEVIKNDDINNDAGSKNDDVQNVKVDKEKVPLKNKVKDLSNKLFSNVPDEDYDNKIYNEEEAIAKKKEKNKEKKAKQAEEKKQLAEETKAKKAEEKEKKKQEKEARKKQSEARKKEAKAKKKALAEEEIKNEPIGRINKLGAIVVFAFVGLIVITVILFASYSRKNIDYKKQAQVLMDKGNYELAYINLLKDSNLDKESKLYKQLHIIQSLNKQLSYYSSYISLGDRDEALDALIVGVEKYDANKSKAMSLEIKDEYNDVYDQILKCLKGEFQITASDARQIRDITSDKEYSEKIAQICEESKK